MPKFISSISGGVRLNVDNLIGFRVIPGEDASYIVPKGSDAQPDNLSGKWVVNAISRPVAKFKGIDPEPPAGEAGAPYSYWAIYVSDDKKAAFEWLDNLIISLET